MHSDFRLSPSQREAVCHFLGPCEVIAGPGSGKTAVLTERILCLIRDRKADPASVLVLTFSKASAIEMQTRFMKSCCGAFSTVNFGTFHSVFYNILRLSSCRSLNIIDDATRRRFLKTLLISSFPDPAVRPEASLLASEISRFHNFSGVHTPFKVSSCFPNPELFAGMCAQYDTFLSENGYVDFDSMLSACLKLFSERPDILDRWQKRFRFILVDEFQDINPVQYEIVRLLCEKHKNLFVVGDDDQSIYGFRGSDPSIMQRFLCDFPDTKRIFLSENYRCSTEIAACARRIISENNNRIKKDIRAVAKAGIPVQIRSFSHEKEENLALCRLFEKMDPDRLGECAVICRTHRQSAGLLQEMDRRDIPYVGAKKRDSMFSAQVLGEVHAYFRAAADFQARGALREDLYRVMNRPQRMFPRDICTKERVFPQDLLAAAQSHAGIQTALLQFVRDLELLPCISPALAMRYLMNTMGYADGALRGREKGKGEIRALIENLKQEAAGAGDLRALVQMLEKRLSDADDNKSSGQDLTAAGVHILTMHACKGLQFDRVFLPDLNEGVIPTRRADTPEAIEEERRLLYVAITRAKRELTLMYVGGTNENPRRPTRFLGILGVRAYT